MLRFILHQGLYFFKNPVNGGLKNQVVTLGPYLRGQHAVPVNGWMQRGLQAPGRTAQALHNAVWGVITTRYSLKRPDGDEVPPHPIIYNRTPFNDILNPPTGQLFHSLLLLCLFLYANSASPYTSLTNRERERERESEEDLSASGDSKSIIHFQIVSATASTVTFVPPLLSFLSLCYPEVLFSSLRRTS